MKTTGFRHNEYMITEISSGDLFWQSHYGFGSFREGRCYIKGSILFFAPADNRDIGFLIGEFIDNLQRLPQWNRTKYYCHHANIFRCDTGDKVSAKEMQLWTTSAGNKNIADNNSMTNANNSTGGGYGHGSGGGSFKLGNYEIFTGKDGSISWSLPLGQDTIGEGNCSILEDILFIGPIRGKKMLPGAKKRRLVKIETLPNWNRTSYYSYGTDLIEYIPDAGPSGAIALQDGRQTGQKIIIWTRLAEIIAYWRPSINENTSKYFSPLIKMLAKNVLLLVNLVGSSALKLSFYCLDKIKGIRKK